MKPLVFCLAHAGGSASFFAGWQAALGDRLELVPLNYPGRGPRLTEAAAPSFEALVDQMMAAMAGQLASGRPFALLGHSMGATVAWELARRFEALGKVRPRCLFLSSRDSPGFERVHFDPRADDATLCRALEEQGALASAWLSRPRFLKPYLATLRADLALLAARRPIPPSAALPMPSCDALVLYGKSDPAVSPAGLQDWTRFVAGRCELRAFDGGHFYMADALPALMEAIAAQAGLAA